MTTTPPALDRPRGAAFPPPAAERRGAVVLVHGAWVGEWCWSPLLSPLRATGRAVHAVSLRGHGARRHESSPTVTLADHVADVVGLVEALDLREITLVGHSYGGRVITRALTRLSERVAQLVYLDAHAPLLAAGVAPDEPAGDDPAGDGMVPFGEFPPDPAEFGGDAAVRWFTERLVPQSAATLREPFAVPIDPRIGRLFVHATGGGASRFAPYAEAARRDPAWRYAELPGSHWLMVAHPGEVAALILDPAAPARSRADRAQERST